MSGTDQPVELGIEQLNHLYIELERCIKEKSPGVPLRSSGTTEEIGQFYLLVSALRAKS